MSTTAQIKKNIELSGKLADYIVSNPYLSKGVYKNSSFVIFTTDDEEFNKMNEELISGLIQEGKNVIKVLETKDTKNPWKFTPLAN